MTFDAIIAGITRLISTGTTEQALLAVAAPAFPELTPAELSQALQVATAAHDVTVLLGGWRSVQPPRPQPQCERFLKDQSIPNYYKECMEAVAGRPQEALRLL